MRRSTGLFFSVFFSFVGLIAGTAGSAFVRGDRGLLYAQSQVGVAPSSEATSAAARGNGREPWLIAYDAPSRRLIFERAGTKGIERGGVRHVAWDLAIEELNPKLAESGRVPVTAIRAIIEKSRPPAFPAGGPEPGGKAALASTQGTGGEPWAFLFDATTDRLAAYRGGEAGIEIKGVRQITWDLMIEELDPRGTKAPTLIEVRQAMERQGRKPEVQGSPDRPREVLLAAARGTSGDPWAILYDVSTRRLAAYRGTNRGIDLEGLREVRWDLRLDSLDPALVARKLRVAEARALVEKKASVGPEAAKEAEPGIIRLAVTQATADEPAVFLHATASHKIVTYRVSSQGLELRGVRSISGDIDKEELGRATQGL
jgi:hypothetical protein